MKKFKTYLGLRLFQSLLEHIITREEYNCLVSYNCHRFAANDLEWQITDDKFKSLCEDVCKSLKDLIASPKM